MVNVSATCLGTPTSRMSIIASPVITVLAVKLQRFPISVPRKRPVLLLKRSAMDFCLEFFPFLYFEGIRVWSKYMCTASCIL